MDQLIEAFELVLLRIRCGQTLTQALRGLAKPKISAEILSQWEKLYSALQSGVLSAEKGICAFLQYLKLRQKLQGLCEQKTLIPKLQSLIIIFISLAFTALSFFLFPENLKARPEILGISFTLSFLGYASTHFLIRSFEQRLWFAQWLMFLSNLNNHLSAGYTLGQSLHQELNGAKEYKTWPAVLVKNLKLLNRAIQTGEAVPDLESPPFRAPATFVQAHEHLKIIAQQYTQGEPICELLEKLLPSCTEVFERQMILESEKLSLWVLLPMFVFYFPSFLILVFAPLLSLLVTQG